MKTIRGLVILGLGIGAVSGVKVCALALALVFVVGDILLPDPPSSPITPPNEGDPP
jgi:hypothetical protein